MSPEFFRIIRHQQGEMVTLRVVGELDLATAPELAEVCEPELAGCEITLDLSEVTFIDCRGLYELLMATSRTPGRVKIIPSVVVARLIELAGLGDRLPTEGEHPSTPRRVPDTLV